MNKRNKNNYANILMAIGRASTALLVGGEDCMGVYEHFTYSSTKYLIYVEKKCNSVIFHISEMENDIPLLSINGSRILTADKVAKIILDYLN